MSEAFQEVLKGNSILRFLFQNSKTNAILVMDEEGYVLCLNEAFQHTYGYTLQDLAGKHTRVLFTDEDQKMLKPEMEVEAVKQQGFASDRNYVIHRDGTCIWTSGESTYTKDDRGSAFLIKIIQNIHEQKLMEKFLKESQGFAESLVSTISDSLLVIDLNQKILKANKCFYSLFGLERASVEGLHLNELNITLFNSEAFTKELHNITEEGSFKNLELEWEEKAGRKKILLVKARFLDGQLVNKKVLFTLTDITQQREEHKRVAESEQLFRSLTEAIPQKVWTGDEKGRRNYFNHLWYTYTGLTQEQLMGYGWIEVIHPEDWKTNRSKWQEAINEGNGYEFEHRLRNKQGEYRWHLSRAVVQKDEKGRVIMQFGTSTDIHDKKNQEEQLEKKVQQRTEELQQANEQLKRSNKDLEQFAFVSSHDLQEPLRKILLFGDLLQKQLSQQLKGEGREYLTKITEAAHRMTILIRGILEYSQLNQMSSKLNGFEQVDLNKVVAEILQDLEIQVKEKGAQVETQRLPILEGIPIQITQLFYNLLSNSLKFIKPDQTPLIQISSTALSTEEVHQYKLSENREYCKVAVTDNGIGFDEVFAERIFEVFQRLHTKEQYMGTGIGLALCKKVVENHGGLIIAEGKEGEGASFSIILPVKQETKEYSKQQVIKEASLK